MGKVGIHIAPVIHSIFPRNPRDTKTSWLAVMPNMYGAIENIQIGTQYIFSIEAHQTLHYLILSANHRATYLDIRNIENLLSFIFDTLCMITFPKQRNEGNKYYKGIKGFLRFMGHPYKQKFAVEERMVEIYEQAAIMLSDVYTRMPSRTIIKDPRQKCLTCTNPSNANFRHAIATYRQALTCIEPQGAILNYWRCIEATTKKPPDQQRYNLIKTLNKIHLKPIWVFKDNPMEPFNLMTKYKRHILRYLQGLVATHGSEEKVLDHLFHKRRCPSAHANCDILDVSVDVHLVSLYEDALLLKYMSRCAIEQYWKTL